MYSQCVSILLFPHPHSLQILVSPLCWCRGNLETNWSKRAEIFDSGRKPEYLERIHKLHTEMSSVKLRVKPGTFLQWCRFPVVFLILRWSCKLVIKTLRVQIGPKLLSTLYQKTLNAYRCYQLVVKTARFCCKPTVERNWFIHIYHKCSYICLLPAPSTCTMECLTDIIRTHWHLWNCLRMLMLGVPSVSVSVIRPHPHPSPLKLNVHKCRECTFWFPETYAWYISCSCSCLLLLLPGHMTVKFWGTRTKNMPNISLFVRVIIYVLFMSKTSMILDNGWMNGCIDEWMNGWESVDNSTNISAWCSYLSIWEQLKQTMCVTTKQNVFRAVSKCQTFCFIILHLIQVYSMAAIGAAISEELFSWPVLRPA